MASNNATRLTTAQANYDALVTAAGDAKA